MNLEKMVKGGSFSASCSFVFCGALHLAVAKQRPKLLQWFMLSACLAQYAVKVKGSPSLVLSNNTNCG